MTVLELSPNGAMVKLGDNPKTAIWYYIENVSLDGISKGDEVEFEFKKTGKGFCLDSLNKVGSAPQPKTEVKTEAKKEPEAKVEPKSEVSKKDVVTPEPEPRKKVVIKDPGIVVDIKFQAGKMTAESLVGLSEIITPQNYGDVIGKVFDTYVNKLTSNIT